MMEQKVVLITGGSRGIGAATARRFAAGGCKVVISYHRSQAQAEASWRRRLGAGRCRQTWPIRSKWEEWLTMCWINIVNLTF